MTSLKNYKILFVTSELYPFIKVGGLADVSSALPKMLAELGNEVRILVPKYGAIDIRKFKIHDVVRLKDIKVKQGKDDILFSMKSSFLPFPKARIQIYFLDNPEYFGNRKSVYGDIITGEGYPDNDERFALFSRGVFELILRLGWVPDIIVCNDWYTGLVPVYFDTIYKNDPHLASIKILYTIHNFAEQGIFPNTSLSKIGLPNNLKPDAIFEQGNKLNFMKAGISFAHYINTVSPTYATEVMQDKNISLGLHPVLEKKKSSFAGLLNGIDTNVWDPEKDKYLPVKYGINNIKDKIESKRVLAKKFYLEFNEDIPIIGLISRLTEEKGIDLFIDSFEKLSKLNCQIVLLGAGQKNYHIALLELHKKYKEKFGLFLGFDDELAHIIEAGSDMFLLPSKYEPCGLNQMYSLVYGTVPIVRKTGGLADTVFQFDPASLQGNGFVFDKYSVTEMVKAVKNAVNLFSDKEIWNTIIKNGMKSDFSWKTSTKMYLELFKTILTKEKTL